MAFHQEFWFKTSTDSLFLSIIVTLTLFHISRLHYNGTKLTDDIDDLDPAEYHDKCHKCEKCFKKSNNIYKKWVTTRTASFLAIFPAIASRSIIYIYIIIDSNDLLNNKTCKWIIVLYMELGGIQKLGRDLFVLLRANITKNKNIMITIPNRALWNIIVCKRILLSLSIR